MKTVVVKPLITELSMKDASSGKFTFLVAPAATKTEVRQAVEKIFNVNVVGISTVSMTRNKTVLTKFGRKKIKTNLKKARVELKKGQTIPAFEVGEKKDKKGKKQAQNEEK